MTLNFKKGKLCNGKAAVDLDTCEFRRLKVVMPNTARHYSDFIK